jgi:hypothetical protein
MSDINDLKRFVINKSLSLEEKRQLQEAAKNINQRIRRGKVPVNPKKELHQMSPREREVKKTLDLTYNAFEGSIDDVMSGLSNDVFIDQADLMRIAENNPKLHAHIQQSIANLVLDLAQGLSQSTNADIASGKAPWGHIRLFLKRLDEFVTTLKR